MLGAYMNQDITIKRRASTDSYNQAIYQDVSIKARFEYKRKHIRDKNGNKITSEAQLITNASVNEDDVIFYAGKTWQIIKISEAVGLGGTVEWYEVSL